jgi:uncharacterized protein (TIGR03790 family)
MAGVFPRWRLGMSLLYFALLVSNAHAGGSGLNTVVVVNQASSNSCELGNYYCEARHVPAENVLRVYWPGGNTLWTSNDFQTTLLTPLLDMLAARQLTNQIDYVVISMDVPFQTSFGSTINGTTSALFYGLRAGDGSDLGVTNSYAASEAVFRRAPPASAPGYSFLTTMITATSLTQAEALVNQGVAGDNSFSTKPVVLEKSSDTTRNIRYTAYDNAIFNVDLRGVSAILRTNSDSLWWPGGCLGLETGQAQFSVPPATFVPGAVADSLTSFGGVIFGPNSQTNLLAFIDAGAAGSYGTVAEPGTDPQKFPDPQVYFYLARGFSLAESYYQSLNTPYLGLTVAEPLSAPFARRGLAYWGTNSPNSVLSGTALLSVRFSAAADGRPLQQVDLFVDGRYFSTLTNVAPCAGNVLNVCLNGFPITCTVPSNATLATLSAALTAAIDDPAVTNATGILASAHGDRVELRSTSTNALAVPFYVADTGSTSALERSYQVSYLPDSFPPKLISSGRDANGVFHLLVQTPTGLPYVIEASTNLLDWIPMATNTVPGLVEFEDPAATNFPSRFYRVMGPVPGVPPALSADGTAGDGSLQLHLASWPGQPCAVLASTNLTDWAPILTNQAGGSLDFADSGATNAGWRFYRAWLVPPAAPEFTVLNGATGTTLVRIDSAVQPYTVEVTTNGSQWLALSTNFAVGEVKTTVGTAIGTGNYLSTFLAASRPTFLDSQALGRQAFIALAGTPPVGAWLQFTFTLTNGAFVVVGVTNQSAGATAADLTGQLCNLINTTPALQGPAGVVAEDFTVNLAGTATFNLLARSPGYEAAAVQVLPQSSGVILLPSSQRTLTQNLSDLLPRNHLYVTAGADSLTVGFPLDTTALSDGYHTLTAVAYEGSHVRTETCVTAPVRVQNSPLSAVLTLLDLPDPAPVAGTYHIQVAANTNDVSRITLFSTGGALGTATNESTATFQVDGTNLWAGLHPFYALVETSSGLKYQTQTSWVRLVNGP